MIHLTWRTAEAAVLLLAAFGVLIWWNQTQQDECIEVPSPTYGLVLACGIGPDTPPPPGAVDSMVACLQKFGSDAVQARAFRYKWRSVDSITITPRHNTGPVVGYYGFVQRTVYTRRVIPTSLHDSLQAKLRLAVKLHELVHVLEADGTHGVEYEVCPQIVFRQLEEAR